MYEVLRVTDEIRELIVEQRPARRDAQAGGQQGHAHAAGRGAPPRRRRRHHHRRDPPRPSTWCRRLSDAEVQVRRHRRRTGSRSRAPSGPSSRDDAELALLRAGARGHQGHGEAEPPRRSRSPEEGQARRGHALLAPARGVPARRHPDPRRGARARRGERATSRCGGCWPTSRTRCAAARRFSDAVDRAPEGLPRASTAASCARPSSPASSTGARPARRYIERDLEARRKIKSALTYPAGDRR